MSYSNPTAARRAWKLKQMFRIGNRVSNAKNRCAQCTVEIPRGFTRCKNCGDRMGRAR